MPGSEPRAGSRSDEPEDPSAFLSCMRKRENDDFDAIDLAIFVACTGVALIGALTLVQKDEPFLYISSFGLALGFMVTSILVARSPPRAGSHAIPLFSVFHLAFWIVQFSYALHSGTAHHAANAHERVVPGLRHAVVWVVMGSVGGFYQGTARSKLALFVGSTLFVTGRNVVLALRWEQAQAQPARWHGGGTHEPSVSRLLSEVRAAAFGYTPLRLPTELVLNGWYCFVGAMLLGLVVGMVSRERSQQQAERRSKREIEMAEEMTEVMAERVEQLRREKERMAYELMIAQHTAHPSRPVGSDGSTSCMSELRFDDDDDDDADASKKTPADHGFTAIRTRGDSACSDTSNVTSRGGSELFNENRAEALWRTLEESGIMPAAGFGKAGASHGGGGTTKREKVL